MLKLIYSNNYSSLKEELIKELNQKKLNSPFAKRIFLTQTQGMQKWLSLEITKKNNIFASFEFININDVFLRLYSLLNNKKIYGLYNKNTLKWLIAEIITNNKTELDLIEKYLAEENASGQKDTNSAKTISDYKREQLATKIADLFDQYMIFRPELIRAWNKGESFYKEPELAKHEKWQQRIWQEVKQKLAPFEEDRTTMMAEIIHKLQQNSNLKSKIRAEFGNFLPVFGFSMMPSFYLDLFINLANFIDISFYLMNPCREYWYDIRKIKDINRARFKKAQKTDSLQIKNLTARIDLLAENELAQELLHFETGNTLLASFGKIGRDFFENLLEKDIYEDEEQPFREFGNESNNSILNCIKNDLLNLKETPQNITSDDSIKIISCHSKLREVEVLRNYLLDLFNHNPSLKANDILVLAPSISEYASFIDAVFKVSKQDELYIPYTISKKHLSGLNSPLGVISRILELAANRAEVNQIYQIITAKPIREKFNFSDEDLVNIQRWLENSGIKWQFKNENESNFKERFSWDKGLEKIMLSHAMQEKEGEEFNQNIPFANFTLGESKAFGDFYEIVEAIFKLLKHSHTKKPINYFIKLFTELADILFTESESEDKHNLSFKQILKNIKLRIEPFSDSQKNQELGITEQEIYFEVFCNFLKSQIAHSVREDDLFMHKGISFASLIPMRSIPFKVIYLLGMDNDSFPRKNNFSDFDLIHLKPQRGDRDIRESDLYLFLETLLSAKEKLYISYVGKDVKDDSERMMSTTIRTLLDYLQANYGIVEEEFIIQHHLQPFSKAYLDGSDEKFFTYEEFFSSNRNSENKHDKEKKDSNSSDKRENSNSLAKEISFKDFALFFKENTKFYYEKILQGIILEPAQSLESSELIEPNNLENYSLLQEVINVNLKKKNLAWTKLKADSMGKIPYGNFGDLYFREKNITAEQLIATIKEKLSYNLEDYQLKRFDYTYKDLKISDIGALVCEKEALLFYPSKLNAKQKIEAMLIQLLCNLKFGDFNTVLVALDDAVKFNSASNPEELFEELYKIYLDGTKKALPFFPESSFMLAEEFEKQKNKKDNAENIAIKNGIDALFIDPFKGKCEISTLKYAKHFFEDKEKFEKKFKDDFFKISCDIYDVYKRLESKE